MAKLYFCDTGVACHLLNITDSGQLQNHFLRGSLFENMIIMELVKHYANSGQDAPLIFWRDKTGNEIDCLIELPVGFSLIEIKSAQTYHGDFVKNLHYYDKLNKGKFPTRKFVVYAGNVLQHREDFTLIPWNGDLAGQLVKH